MMVGLWVIRVHTAPVILTLVWFGLDRARHDPPPHTQCHKDPPSLLREVDTSGLGHVQGQLSGNCDPPEMNNNVPRDRPRVECTTSWFMGPGWAGSHQNQTECSSFATLAAVGRIEDCWPPPDNGCEGRCLACGICAGGGTGLAVCL